MGNGLRKLSFCFAGDAGTGRNDVNVGFSDEGLGHSFCYIPPEPPRKATKSEACTTAAAAAHKTPLYRTISGAAISANTFTHLSTDAYASYPSLDKASAFESSSLFTSIPLQPIPRNSVVKSGPILRSEPIEGGFLSGPIERSFISGPLDDQLQRYMPKSKKRAFLKNFKSMSSNFSSTHRYEKEQSFFSAVSASNSGNSSTITSHNLSSEMSMGDENDDVVNESALFGQNLQWAQGKAGEDRVHVVISEEHGWVFVGIYDGFNGPDATDFLLNNLYSSVYKELKGLLWSESSEVSPPANHSGILIALSEALRKTEASFLEMADLMLLENPELALMGSCVLVMVMKGLDVYLMNVGDSRAVLAQKNDNHLEVMRKSFQDSLYGYEYENVHSLRSCQLTTDHTTTVKEEVRRIRNAHPEDPLAVTNDRVKGSLKVTRAFGAGFLKQPKWNNALLEMFRIDYIGSSPYITCSPWLFHHTLKPEDKFLILSSDGLFQYFTNQEAVSEVEMFMSTFPEGDPAQHLVEEVLFRAAKKAGMDFHELLDIPQGDRRRYHDDVSIIILSFNGRIWRSSV